MEAMGFWKAVAKRAAERMGFADITGWAVALLPAVVSAIWLYCDHRKDKNVVNSDYWIPVVVLAVFAVALFLINVFRSAPEIYREAQAEGDARKPILKIEHYSCRVEPDRLTGAWLITVSNLGASTTLRNWILAVSVDGRVCVHGMMRQGASINYPGIQQAWMQGNIGDEMAPLETRTHRDYRIAFNLMEDVRQLLDSAEEVVWYIQFQDVGDGLYGYFSPDRKLFERIEPSTLEVIRAKSLTQPPHV